MKVLVVVDMQKDFVDGSLGGAGPLSIVPSVCGRIRAYSGEEIVATLDTHGADYLSRLEGRKLPVVHCVEGTPGWRLDARVAEALRDAEAHGARVSRFNKPTFGTTAVAKHLQTLKNAPESIEICGLCTDICVVSNALILRAFFPDTPMLCDHTCCAGTSQEAHDAALAVMRSCQIDVL